MTCSALHKAQYYVFFFKTRGNLLLSSSLDQDVSKYYTVQDARKSETLIEPNQFTSIQHDKSFVFHSMIESSYKTSYVIFRLASQKIISCNTQIFISWYKHSFVVTSQKMILVSCLSEYFIQEYLMSPTQKSWEWVGRDLEITWQKEKNWTTLLNI